jgi:hypothetical protein
MIELTKPIHFLRHDEIVLARDVGYYNIRGDRYEKPLTEEDHQLYASICNNKIWNPITVVPFKGQYLLLNGEGRYLFSKFAIEQNQFPPAEQYDDNDIYLLPTIIDEDHPDPSLEEYHELQWHHNQQEAVSHIKRIEFFVRKAETMLQKDIERAFGVAGSQLSNDLKIGRSKLWPLVADNTLKATTCLEVLRKATLLEEDPYDLYETLIGIYGQTFTQQEVKDYFNSLDEANRPDFENMGGSRVGGFQQSELGKENRYVNGEENQQRFANPGDEEEEENRPDPSKAKELDPKLKKINEVGTVIDLSGKGKFIANPQKMYEFLEEIENLDPMFLAFYNLINEALQGIYTDKQLKEKLSDFINEKATY